MEISGLRLWNKIEAKREPQYSRNKHTAVVHKNKLLVFGGYSLQQRQFYNDILEFDFDTHEWQELAVIGQFPSKRRAHSCTVLGNGALVVFGGYNGDYCLNDVHTFDVESRRWGRQHCVGDIPPQRGGHTAVAWKGDCVVILGGWDVGNVYYDCIYLLHTVDWRWERLRVTSAYQPVGRVGHTCVLHHDNNIFMFGGYGTDGYWDDLNHLNLLTGAWTKVEVVGVRPCQRTFSSMEIFGNRILLFGGSNHDIEMNDTMVFDTETCKWQTVDCPGQVPEGRFAHVSCVFNHKVYFYGGIVRGSAELTGVYELTLEHFTCTPTLGHLLNSWIVNTGFEYRSQAAGLPGPVLQALEAYRAQISRMEEWERAAQEEASDAMCPDAAAAKLMADDAEEDEDDDSSSSSSYEHGDADSDFGDGFGAGTWDLSMEDVPPAAPYPDSTGSSSSTSSAAFPPPLPAFSSLTPKAEPPPQSDPHDPMESEDGQAEAVEDDLICDREEETVSCPMPFPTLVLPGHGSDPRRRSLPCTLLPHAHPVGLGPWGARLSPLPIPMDVCADPASIAAP